MEKYQQMATEHDCLQEGGLGLFIIKALMDEVDIFSELGMGTRIKMVKYLRKF